ncbi:MAG: hypothetical protein AB7O04_16485 [Hyphomonadaceae bacterium]
MADSENRSGGSSWLGFIAAILLVAVVGLGIYAYTGGMERQTASLEIEMPDAPDIDLPEAPVVPPTVQEGE